MSKVSDRFNESGSIIRSVTNIANDINLEYRTSKLPKFIKNIRYKAHMSELSKHIEKMKGIQIIDFSLLNEFLGLFLNDFDNKSYDCKGCKRLESNEDNIQATFIFPIIKSEEEIIGKIAVTFITHEDNFDMLYAIYIDMKEKGKYTKDNIKVLKLNKPERKFYTEEDTSNANIVNDIIFNGLTDNIYRYLRDYIERLERITDE